MSDDFGTVNVRRGDRAREIEVLRQHYREHREALHRLSAEAPSEHLAAEYGRLVHDIEASLAKLDEIEGRAAATGAAAATSATAATNPAYYPPVQPAAPARSAAPVAGAAAAAAAPAQRDPVRPGVEPGARTLTPSPGDHDDDDTYPGAPAPGLRLPLIIVAGLLVLAIIGYLIWRASSEKRAASEPAIVETSAPVTASESDSATGTVVPVGEDGGAAAQTSALTIAPELADYGTIRKGTRAARQFEVANKGTTSLQFQVARSQCRCLFYEYSNRIEPGKKDTITVTVDGARAKSGTLQETIVVTSRTDPAVKASFQVQATIQ